MAKVITMEEREAGRKLRGIKKFGKKVRKVAKEIGEGIEKGAKTVKEVAKHALSNPQFRNFAKEKLKSGLYWLAGHPLADKLSYGNSKELKNWVDPIVEASDSYTGPKYFGRKTNFGFKPTAPNTVSKAPPVPPKRPAKTPPKIPTKSPAFIKAQAQNDALYA